MIKRYFIVLLLVFSVAQLSFYGCDGEKKDNKSQLMMLALAPGGDYTPTPPAGGVAATADWNFLVYIDGDNNLEDAAIYNFCQMELVGSTAQVNVLVLIDRIRGYDSTHGNWTGTRLYRVTNNPTSDPSDSGEFSSTLLSEWGPRGEADMSDPATLQKFIEYCHEWFPATRTVLTLWNHGAGVYPRSVTPKGLSQGICFDDTTGRSEWNCLTTDEVAAALTDAQAVTGQQIDIINLDACLMQLVEVAYQWYDCADYLVGSEETIPWNGNDYYTFLTHLTGTPTMTPQTLATTLVDDFYNFYDINMPFEAVTYSAIDLTRVNTFITGNFASLATALNNNTTDHNVITDAYVYSTHFDYPEIIDLDNFVTYIEDNAINAGLVTAATAVKTDIEAGSLIIHQHATGGYSISTHGLAITLPDSSTWDYYSGADRYAYLAISADTNWDEFILKFITW